jgi:hypothetical protein
MSCSPAHYSAVHLQSTTLLIFTASKLTNSVTPKPAVSSQYLKATTIGRYPEPTGSTLYLPDSHLKINSDPILPSTPQSSKLSLSFRLSNKNPLHFPLLSHASHKPRPPHSLYLIYLIISGMSTYYEAPHCATSSILLTLHPPLVQIFSLGSCSQTPSVYACLLM